MTSELVLSKDEMIDKLAHDSHEHGTAYVKLFQVVRESQKILTDFGVHSSPMIATVLYLQPQ